MKKLILLMVLLCLPIAMAAICEDRIDNGSSCLMLTPELTCTDYTYDIFLSNGTSTAINQTLTLLNGSMYYFNFSNQTGDYIVNLCDGRTREFRVTETYDTKFQEEEESRMFIAIAIFLIGITICLFYLGVTQKSRNFQIGFFLLGFLFLVADLFFAARVTETLNPQYTGIISNLDTMYAVGLYTFVFLMSVAGIYLLFKLFDWLKNYKKIKLQRDEEDWFQSKD